MYQQNLSFSDNLDRAPKQTSIDLTEKVCASGECSNVMNSIHFIYTRVMCQNKIDLIDSLTNSWLAEM